ncbi:MAG: hypothetical protein HYV08_02005, partial [Deltaproteobacteria bacterium]|nr:hypothetical protein [Deltaproteobacteria bacterium]
MSDLGPYRAGLAGLVILAVGIGLLSAPGAADAQTRLKYLTGARELTMIPVFVAEDQGYFRNQGLALEITLMPGAPLVISGV